MALARAQAKPAALIPSGCPGGRCTSKHYDEDRLATLAALIAGINAWNRLNVMPAAVYPGRRWESAPNGRWYHWPVAVGTRPVAAGSAHSTGIRPLSVAS